MTTKHHHHGTPPLPALNDRTLITHLRDAIAEARGRAALKSELRHLLADELGELKAEALSAAGLTAEEIADHSTVDAGTDGLPEISADMRKPLDTTMSAADRALWDKFDSGEADALRPREVVRFDGFNGIAEVRPPQLRVVDGGQS